MVSFISARTCKYHLHQQEEVYYLQLQRVAANPFGKAVRAFTPVGLATIGAGALKDVSTKVSKKTSANTRGEIRRRYLERYKQQVK